MIKFLLLEAMPKFLCITAHDPDGPDYGSTLRVRHLFRLLARLGDVRVVLVGYFGAPDNICKDPRREFEIIGRVRCCFTSKLPLMHRLRRQFDSRFLNIEGVQAPPDERERLLQLMSRHDMVWIHNVKVANAIGIWRWPKSVLDMDDLSSEFSKTYLINSSGLVEKIRNLNHVILWSRQERKVKERFNAVCVCSEADRMKLPDQENIFVLPNGYQLPEKEPERHPAVPMQIGFVGTFKYSPNRDGVQWFIDRIWPGILGHFPTARLRLVGDRSDELKWKKPNIDSLGFVPDLSREMAGWSLAIVPVLTGAGTRIKIADAFSRKCPVVSTPLGAYGYEVRDGRELFIAKTPKDFLAKCLRILERPAIGVVLADNAWRKFREKWTWHVHAERVSEIVNTVLNGPNQTSSAQNSISEAA